MEDNIIIILNDETTTINYAHEDIIVLQCDVVFEISSNAEAFINIYDTNHNNIIDTCEYIDGGTF